MIQISSFYIYLFLIHSKLRFCVGLPSSLLQFYNIVYFVAL